MPNYVVPPLDVTVLPVVGMDAYFPVRRVFAIGQNYAEHVVELGGVPEKKTPLFFTKPADAVVPEGGDVPYPPMSNDVHHELEMVVALKEGGSDIPVEDAERRIFGYATGIDFTRRDLQFECKKKGRPWDVAKAFDHSAPVSAITPIEQSGPMLSGGIHLSVNGEVRQDGDLKDMIWSVNEIISELSRYFELKAGDLIFTGTPSGVSAIHEGDEILGQIDGLQSISCRILGTA